MVLRKTTTLFAPPRRPCHRMLSVHMPDAGQLGIPSAMLSSFWRTGTAIMGRQRPRSSGIFFIFYLLTHLVLVSLHRIQGRADLDNTTMVHFENEAILSGRSRLAATHDLARKNYCIIDTKSCPYQNNPLHSRPICMGYVVNFLSTKSH